MHISVQVVANPYAHFYVSINKDDNQMNNILGQNTDSTNINTTMQLCIKNDEDKQLHSRQSNFTLP